MSKAKKKARKRKAKKKAEIVQTTAIVRAEPSVLAHPSAVPTIHEAVKNMERVRRFISSCMNVDLQRELAKLSARTDWDAQKKSEHEIALRERMEIDWGTIPGVDKPFLKQPGAEKFLWWLNLRPRFNKREITSTDGHLEIVCSVTVFSKKTGEEVFEGPDCSCSTMESNYRFRFSEHEGPAPSREEAEKLKAAGLGKWRKKKTWAHGKYIGENWVWYDRVENPNIHDERNKVRQIGEKRALVKCIRNMGALSEIFVADPSEWNIPDEDDNPRNDENYTPSGRRIVVEQRAPTEEVYQGKPTAEQVRIAEEKEADLKRKMDEQMEQIAKDKDMNRAPAGQRTTVSDRTASLSTNDRTTGATLSASPSPAAPASAAKREEAEKPTETRAERKSAPSHSALTVGVIQYARPEVTKGQGIQCLRVNWAGYVVSCFDKKLWPYLGAAVDIEAELMLAENRQKIVGIRRIGKRMFENGNIPVIQNNEERVNSITPAFFQ